MWRFCVLASSFSRDNFFLCNKMARRTTVQLLSPAHAFGACSGAKELTVVQVVQVVVVGKDDVTIQSGHQEEKQYADGGQNQTEEGQHLLQCAAALPNRPALKVGAHITLKPINRSVISVCNCI